MGKANVKVDARPQKPIRLPGVRTWQGQGAAENERRKTVRMISLTRFNGTNFYVNAEMIVFVEGTPDAVITLQDKSKIVVREEPAEIVAYRQRVRQDLLVNNKDA